jgi:hypothetical protein
MIKPIFVTHPNGRERVNVAHYPFIELEEVEIHFSSDDSETYWVFETKESAKACFDEIVHAFVGVRDAIHVNNVVMLPEIVKLIGVYQDEEGWFIDITSTTGNYARFDFASEKQAMDAFKNYRRS